MGIQTHTQKNTYGCWRKPLTRFVVSRCAGPPLGDPTLVILTEMSQKKRGEYQKEFAVNTFLIPCIDFANQRSS